MKNKKGLIFQARKESWYGRWREDELRRMRTDRIVSASAALRGNFAIMATARTKRDVPLSTTNSSH
jgi:hypothetical protein